jgi:hypothetical protein
MKFSSLFRLRDVTHSTLVIPGMTQHDFMAKIASVTDQGTNVGFLTRGKKFHGLINNDRFRLKRIRTFRRDEFVVQGEVRSQGDKLIVDLKFIRGFVPTLLPKFFFIMMVVFFTGITVSGKLDWRYIPFIVAAGLLFAWGSEVTRQKEIAKLKELILEIIHRH